MKDSQIHEEDSKTWELIADTWNAFVDLPSLHPDETNEFRFHIHALQHMIYMRKYYREKSRD